MRFLLIFTLVIFSTSCSSAILEKSSIPTAQNFDRNIECFVEKPNVPFIEKGYIETEIGILDTDWMALSAGIAELKEQAKIKGANGLIVFHPTTFLKKYVTNNNRERERDTSVGIYYKVSGLAIYIDPKSLK